MLVTLSNYGYHLRYNNDTNVTTITMEIYGKECILAERIMGLSECFSMLELFDEQPLGTLFNSAITRIS